MDNHPVNVIMQFMQRVQLQGVEVPAFNTCMEWLQDVSTSLNAPDDAVAENPEGLGS